MVYSGLILLKGWMGMCGVFFLSIFLCVLPLEKDLIAYMF